MGQTEKTPGKAAESSQVPSAHAGHEATGADQLTLGQASWNSSVTVDSPPSCSAICHQLPKPLPREVKA